MDQQHSLAWELSSVSDPPTPTGSKSALEPGVQTAPVHSHVPEGPL